MDISAQRPRRLAGAVVFALLLTTLFLRNARADEGKCYFYKWYGTPDGGAVCSNAGTSCMACKIKV